MEAICYEDFVDHFNNQLTIGTIYLFNRVQFDPAEMPLPFKLSIQSDFIMVSRRQTEIQPAMAQTVVPRLPHRFTHFRTVYRLPNKMLAGTSYFFLLVYVNRAISTFSI